MVVDAFTVGQSSTRGNDQVGETLQTWDVCFRGGSKSVAGEDGGKSIHPGPGRGKVCEISNL